MSRTRYDRLMALESRTARYLGTLPSLATIRWLALAVPTIPKQTWASSRENSIPRSSSLARASRAHGGHRKTVGSRLLTFLIRARAADNARANHRLTAR